MGAGPSHAILSLVSATNRLLGWKRQQEGNPPVTRTPAFTRYALLAGLACLALAAAILLTRSGGTSGGTVGRPIDPRQQTALAFRERSHWLQPWRAYLDTPPATRLRNAIGINFNVEPAEADATARLLAASGIRRARVEFGWSSLAFRGPPRLRDPARFQTVLAALSRHGIRPLILLNAHHGAPGPTRFFTATLTSAARAGDRSVQLDDASAQRVLPRRSGLNAPDGKAADVIFTGVGGGGVATLSKPLPRDLAAGPHPAAALRFEPFGPPRLADGRPNPVFERTLAGWLDYARVIAREARAVLGSNRFDLEIWNELSFGSDFLYQDRYYEPDREDGQGEATRVILERTVRALRASPEGRGTRIGDGFASQTPFAAGSTSPHGLTAIGKHPYYPIRRFPQHSRYDHNAPLDARGRRDFEEEKGPDGKPVRRDRFVPSYDAFFPEYALSAIQTEHFVRDLSPIVTEVKGIPHGRSTHPPGGRPPEIWVTEANLDPTGADPADPDDPARARVAELSQRETEHLFAKAALRYYTAFANKGATAIDLFAAKDRTFGLVNPAFFGAVARSGGAYPGPESGGEVMTAVRRLGGALRGARRIARPQRLSLLRISDKHDHTQFDGDGSARHPPLYDRDVVAFFPFQLGPGEHVAAAYVMTRNMARVHDSDASGPARYDLPGADFRLTVGGLGRGALRATATDPLTGASVGAKIVSRRGDRAVLELPLTDSVRLLRLRSR